MLTLINSLFEIGATLVILATQAACVQETVKATETEARAMRGLDSVLYVGPERAAKEAIVYADLVAVLTEALATLKDRNLNRNLAYDGARTPSGAQHVESALAFGLHQAIALSTGDDRKRWIESYCLLLKQYSIDLKASRWYAVGPYDGEPYENNEESAVRGLGFSLSRIREKMNEEGILKPSQWAFRGGVHFSDDKDAIRIVNNQHYIRLDDLAAAYKYFLMDYAHSRFRTKKPLPTVSSKMAGGFVEITRDKRQLLLSVRNTPDPDAETAFRSDTGVIYIPIRKLMASSQNDVYIDKKAQIISVFNSDPEASVAEPPAAKKAP